VNGIRGTAYSLIGITSLGVRIGFAVLHAHRLVLCKGRRLHVINLVAMISKHLEGPMYKKSRVKNEVAAASTSEVRCAPFFKKREAGLWLSADP